MPRPDDLSMLGIVVHPLLNLLNSHQTVSEGGGVATAGAVSSLPSRSRKM